MVAEIGKKAILRYYWGMITCIEGVVKFNGLNFLVIDVSGVGYKVFVSAETMRKMPKSGGKAFVWTHSHYREDAAVLYGFLNYAELEFFEQLIQISGIGPKSGLAVLAVGPLDILKRAIASGETSYLTKVSGVGHKLAEKIVVELRDKLSSVGIENEGGAFHEEEEALEALRSLGYTLKESRDALRGVSKDIKGTENMVKEFGENPEIKSFIAIFKKLNVRGISNIRFNFSLARCANAFSRPRNMIAILTRSPFSKNFCA